MTSRRLGRDVWPYVVRAVRWQPVVVTAFAAVLAGRATVRLPVTVLATVAALGASFTFDDPASRTLAASPTSLGRRRLGALTVMVPLVGLVWTVAVYPLAHGPGGPVPPRVANLELATLLAVVLGTAAFAARRREDGLGSGAAAPVLVAFVLALSLLQQGWPLYPVAGHELAWTLMLVAAAGSVVVGSRDPATRFPPLPASVRA